MVEENLLAFEHLLDLLRRDRSILPLTLESLDGPALQQDKNLIFLVDNSSLAFPLSQALRGIRLRYPHAKFVILDDHRADVDVPRMLWYGIQGFLTHAEVERHLLDAIHSVAEGRMWVAAHLLGNHAIPPSDAGSKGRGISLTQREEQVIELVKRRFSNREIAEMLRIKESTVKFHLSHVFSKMQARSRHDLVNGKETVRKWAAFAPPSRVS
ncbi:MAG TPA: response regulator transcription factor [Candidatus Xenobia bacterium]|nr:response regulator transcription factor [Candidatus Xenobia bacterium]